MDRDTILRIIAEELDNFQPTISADRMAIRIAELLPGPLMDSADLDYHAEPPDGRTFSKEAVRNYCLAAYEKGSEGAFIASLKHMAMHEELVEAAACLGQYIEHEFNINSSEVYAEGLKLARETGHGKEDPIVTMLKAAGMDVRVFRLEGEHPASTQEDPCNLCGNLPCSCSVMPV